MENLDQYEHAEDFETIVNIEFDPIKSFVSLLLNIRQEPFDVTEKTVEDISSVLESIVNKAEENILSAVNFEAMAIGWTRFYRASKGHPNRKMGEFIRAEKMPPENPSQILIPKNQSEELVDISVKSGN